MTEMTNLTILTRKVSIVAFLKKVVRNFAKFVRTMLKSGIIDFEIFKYYGHTAVTRSLIHGLMEINIKFVFNPFYIKNVTDTVFILSDVGALKQAISWKRNGKIKMIIAGPNLVEVPTEYDSILESPEIDLILVSADMSVNIYKKLLPGSINKILPWYSGVDINYWYQNNIHKQKEVTVYWKNAPKPFSHEVEKTIKSFGYRINRVVYGKYSKSEFKNVLSKSLFSVFLSITETQGLALAESWSMNVPTLVWDPGIEHYYLRGIITTSCPYLTPETGLRWKEISELKSILSNMDLTKFSPRDWAAKNMSDKSSAKLLIDIIENRSKALHNLANK